MSLPIDPRSRSWSLPSQEVFDREYETNLTRYMRIEGGGVDPATFPGLTDAELFTLGVRVSLQWITGAEPAPVSGRSGISQVMVEQDHARALDLTGDPDRTVALFAEGIAACLLWLMARTPITYPDDTTGRPGETPVSWRSRAGARLRRGLAG